MQAQKIEELAEVAGIGVERMGRHPPLAAQTGMSQPRAADAASAAGHGKNEMVMPVSSIARIMAIGALNETVPAC